MIEVGSLYHSFSNGELGLADINLELPPGSRTLLIGANGAGKSTLLKLLAGKTLAKSGTILINGEDPFRTCVGGTTYLGTEWAVNETVRRDMPVPLLISSIGGDQFPERRDKLVEILDIDLNWRMNAVSDGERRRVQLCMGLLRPWNLLLLDEVTVDLDVLVRVRLLSFLQKETETRDCQIVYATHIFDGLSTWPTHIVHIRLGTIAQQGTADEMLCNKDQEGKPIGPRLLFDVALGWLSSDFNTRGARKPKPKWADIVKDVEGLVDHSERFSSYFKLTRGRV